MKKNVFVLFLLVTVLLIASSGFAQTVATVSPFIYPAERSFWGEVAEVENVHSDPRVTVSGRYSIFNVAPGVHNSGIWQLGNGYVQTAFTKPSDSLFVNFESDKNDGPADFYIDNVFEYSYNTYDKGWFSVVFTGLSNSAHTLRVEATTDWHIAIDAMGSGAPVNGCTPIPEPATMLLFGPALLGLFGLKRKKA